MEILNKIYSLMFVFLEIHKKIEGDKKGGNSSLLPT